MELCDGKGDTAVKILVRKKEASQEGKLCVLSFYGKQIVKKKKKMKGTYALYYCPFKASH